MATQNVQAERSSFLQEAVKTLVVIVVLSVLLVIVGWTTSQIGVLGERLHALAGIDAPPVFAWIENLAPAIAVVTWVAMALGAAYLIFAASKKQRETLAENWSTLNVIQGIIAAAVLAGLTGYLWAIWNPVPILPPFIHLRIFSFLIGVWGIVLGRATGFLTGYFGSIVWALVAGYFVLPHTPVADGFWVGAMTGWFVSVVVRGGKSRDALLAEIDANRWRYYVKCGLVGLIGGLVMSFFVAASLKVTTPLSWWASFWAIGALSDPLPMVIWIGPVSEAALRLTRRLTWLPNF